MATKTVLRPKGTKAVQTINTTPTRTQVSGAKEADINNIMAKYKRTGAITHIARQQGYYADVSNVPDYATAMNTVTKAQAAFEALPASLRAKLGNDPGRLPAYLLDPANKTEALSLGLIKASTQAADTSTQAVAPASQVQPNPVPNSNNQTQTNNNSQTNQTQQTKT